ncbi:MAG: Gldg family protein [Bacillota bacterium]|nr:Gldg family protein [Bacillota bacterium]
MISIFKRELKGYFITPVAYIIVGLFVLVCSVYYYVGNIRMQTGEIDGLFNSMGIILLFLVPILTMRTIAEDRKNGIEVLLNTSPITIYNIIIGKFLAAFSVFLIMAGITFIYPLMLFAFSKPALGVLLTGYAGFLLLGASMIAVGVFASSLTENQVVAAAVSFITLFLMLVMEPLAYYSGGQTAKILNSISIFSRYDNFIRGILSLSHIIYYLSVIAVFLFLTNQTMEKRYHNLKFSMENNSKKVVNTDFLSFFIKSVVLIVSVFVIVIVLNLLIEKKSIKWDFTSNELFSVGNVTKGILKNLKEDVTIYGLFDDEKADSTYKDIRELLSKYEYYSGAHVKVKFIDPDRNTGIIKKLDPEGSKDLKKNDFVIESRGKSQKLSYDSLFKTEVDTKALTRKTTGSVAEQAFTGAIKYVSSEVTPAVYFVEGQGEGKADVEFKTFSDCLSKNNFIVKSINLSSVDKVPEDAGILLFTSPKRDLEESDAEKVRKYLKVGGKCVFMAGYMESDPVLTQFNALISEYNLSFNHDRVKENDRDNHMPDNPYGLIIEAAKNEVVDSDFQMDLVDSRSIRILKNETEDINIIPLLKAGNSSEGEAIDGENGKNTPGPLNMAVASKKYGKAGNSKVIVIGNSSFISDSEKQKFPQYFSSNMFFLMNALNWMQDREDEMIIQPKEFDTGKLVINQFQASITGFIVIIVIPLHILGFGMFVFLRRRAL